VDVQRGGPSTGLPTKTEQSDLLQAMFGRNGEAPVPIVAPRSPSDAFDAALDAVRIAVTYRTPVLLLSDGAIANGSEPWRLPEDGDLPETPVQFATEPNGPDGTFLPYLRDPDTLARPWAVPGTPGLAHRIGGLEKADLTGNISYEPANHEFMVRVRQAKIDGVEVPDLEVEDPVGPDGGTADVLVLGWGSTYGPIGAAVRRLRGAGHAVAQAHLRHLNPFPANTADVLGRYRKVVVPEMNLGQLAFLLQGRFCIPVESITKVAGMPFGAAELAELLTPIVTKEEVSA
jgi:2-oxoglutarate/2-oxoacid ferredoxin oxidoreductase subunit alpha